MNPWREAEILRRISRANPMIIDIVTVEAGDTLSAVAARCYGDAREWPRIYAENRLAIGADPHRIMPGLVLLIPARPHP